MTVKEIRQTIRSLQDLSYRELQIKILPTVDPNAIIGVRTPALRKLAKKLVRTDDVLIFLNDLPHRFFDENQLHAFILSEIRDFDRCLAAVDAFLPYIDNWATCDQLSPAIFAKNKRELLDKVKCWIRSDKPYVVRFGIGMLMAHYLGDEFDPAYPVIVAGVKSEPYYVTMMIAWYFATALAKRYDDVLPFLQNGSLDDKTQNKTIQKAVESFRLTNEQKAYLKTLKRK